MSFTIGIAELTAQPINDHITDAINLGEGPFPYSELGVDFQDATFSGDSTPNPCGIGTAGIWYKFRATASGVVAAVMVNPNSSIVIFFEGPDNAASGQELTWVDQQTNPCDNGSSSTIQTTPGTTYYIFMKNLSASDVLINVEPAFQAPENDLIENAIDLNGMEDYFEEDIHFLLATITDDGGQQGGCNTGNTPGIWYKFTAGTDGQVIGGLSSGPGNSAIIFFTAGDENAQTGADLTWVNQPTNICNTSNLSSIEATEGTTYYVFVGSADTYADFSINLSGILSTTENTQIEFDYYPNPVVDQLNFNSKSTIDSIKIYNLLGQQVLSQNIKSTSGSVDLRHLAKGMYLAEVTSGVHKTTAKILKK